MKKLVPAVSKIWLHLLAGVMWSGVGAMLNGLASRWLKLVHLSQLLVLCVAGAILAGAIYAFGFSKLALKNILRIEAYPRDRVCLFAFQKWSSYPLVLFMISLGIYLRVYSPIPKPLLAVLYIGIGGGLFLSSLHYYSKVFHRMAEARLPAIPAGSGSKPD